MCVIFAVVRTTPYTRAMNIEMEGRVEVSTETSQNGSEGHFSRDEILEVHEDVFKSGQSMLVRETPEEYAKRVEALWQVERTKLIARFDAQDKEAAVTQALPKEVSPQQGDPSAYVIGKQPTAEQPSSTLETAHDSESYADLANVQLGEKKIRTLLNERKQGKDVSRLLKQAIYEMLTRRSGYVAETDGKGRNAAEYLEGFRVQTGWYRDMRERVAGYVDSYSQLKWNSNPGWFGIHTRPEVSRREGLNVKVYATLPLEDYVAIEHLPDLAERLRQVALDTDDVIQVKMPNGFGGFAACNDSVVIHFKKPENAEKVSETLRSWITENGLHEAPREMGRTQLAGDSNDSSFSDMVAQTISEWLEQHADAYGSEVLAHEAVKYAIERSQTPPNVMA